MGVAKGGAKGGAKGCRYYLLPQQKSRQHVAGQGETHR